MGGSQSKEGSDGKKRGRCRVGRERETGATDREGEGEKVRGRGGKNECRYASRAIFVHCVELYALTIIYVFICMEFINVHPNGPVTEH